MPSAAPWLSPGVNIPLYSIWWPSIATANSDHCADARKTAVLWLNRTSGGKKMWEEAETQYFLWIICPSSSIFRFLIGNVLLEIVCWYDNQQGNLTNPTCFLLTPTAGQKLGSPTFSHLVASCSRPILKQLCALIMRGGVLWWFRLTLVALSPNQHLVNSAGLAECGRILVVSLHNGMLCLRWERSKVRHFICKIKIIQSCYMFKILHGKKLALGKLLKGTSTK